jgi:hypothetical protein
MPLGLSQVLQALFLVHHVGPPANVRRQAALRSTAGGRWCPKRRGNLSIVSDKGVMNCVWALGRVDKSDPGSDCCEQDESCKAFDKLVETGGNAA